MSMLLGPSLAASAAAGSAAAPSYVAGPSAPPFQRFQELARVAGLSRAFTLSVKLQLYTLLRGEHEKQQQQQQGAGGHAAAAAAGAVPRGLTAGAIAERLGLNTSPGFRGVTDWLDLLVSIDVLQRSGEGAADALYANTPDADAYLCLQSPDYMGGHAVLYHDRHFPRYLFMEQSLRTGVQPELANQLVTPVLQCFAGTSQASMAAGATGGDPLAFAQGMTGCNRPGFEQLAAKFDFSRYKTLADVGGSAGALCCAVAKAHPHLSCTTLDLPAVHAAAEQYVAQQGLQDRVKVADIDFFSDQPFPPADVVTLGMILHDWGLARKKLLLAKAYAALPPGGAFVALDLVIDDARRANVWGLLMSLDMLLEFDEERAHDYAFEEFTAWAKEIGFSFTQLLRLVGPNSAAVAYK